MSPFLKRIVSLIEAGGVVTLTATLAGFLGKWSWLFDLCAHFRLQYFVVLLFVSGIVALARRRGLAASFGLGALINLATLVPFYYPPAPSIVKQERTYRAVLINVSTETGSPARVTELIRRVAPDLLLLEEINRQWTNTLQSILAAYPYSEVRTREDNFGIGLYSKAPLLESKIFSPGDGQIPAIQARIDTSPREITFIGIHAIPPAGPRRTRIRNSQLSSLASVVNNASSPLLLLGDLNATPWCHPFKRLVQETSLKNSALGRGIQPTWPASNPFMRIPIDHCLHSPDFAIVNRALGPDIGSDHYPVIVKFSILNL